ncbi:FHA domain-containing protein, partial [Picosynechococcus sp. PCC 7002]|uniref:FHA domain-containing protein n=2 Tax=Cyanobacteriota TaxID=1117 RepID=UPI0030DC4F9C
MQASGILRQISTGGVQAPLLPDFSLDHRQEILIGREPSCQIALNPNLYTVVSRRHVLIRPQGQGWEAVDLGSANGTFINGQRLQGSRILQAGDRLTLGDNGPSFSFELQSQGHNPQAPLDPGSHIPVPGPIVS